MKHHLPNIDALLLKVAQWVITDPHPHPHIPKLSPNKFKVAVMTVASGFGLLLVASRQTSRINGSGFFFFLRLIDWFLSAMGLHCCTQVFIATSGSTCCRAWAFTQGGFLAECASQAQMGSVAVACGLSCSAACESSKLALNPCPLDLQALNHWPPGSKGDFLIELYLG